MGKVEPSNGTFAYEWKWNDGKPASLDPVVPNVIYTTTGKRVGTFTVSASVSANGNTITFPKQAVCETTVGAPDLTANAPVISGSGFAENEPLTGIPQFYENSPLSIRGTVNNTGTLPTKDGLFASEYRYSADGTNWSPWVTTYFEDSTPLGTSAAVQRRPLKPYPGAGQSWTAGILNPNGYWWFEVRADSANVVKESDENNNNSGPTRIKVIKRPPSPTPSIQFNGQGGTLTVGYRDSGTVSWSCGNSSSATASNSAGSTEWNGTVTLAGSVQRISNVTKITDFTITCASLLGNLDGPKSATVTVVPFTPQCSFAPAAPVIGTPVSWSGSAEPSTGGPYAFEWSGDLSGVSSSALLDPTVSVSYSSIGVQTAVVKVSKTHNGVTFPKSVSCNVEVTAPDLTATFPQKRGRRCSADLRYAL